MPVASLRRFAIVVAATFVSLAGCSPVLWALAQLRVHRPPRTVQVGQTVTGDTSAPDQRRRASCAGPHEGDHDADQAWTFVAPEARWYRVRVRGGYDAAVAVYRGFDDRDELGCNDDDGGSLNPRLRVRLERGESYTIVVDGYHGDHGPYELTVEPASDRDDSPVPPASRVPHEDAAAMTARCASAPILTAGAHTGVIDPAVASASTSCGGGGPGGDTIYRLVVPQAATVRIRESSAFDAVLELRASCTAGARALACNDDAPDTRHAAIETHVAAGTYFLVVDSFWERSGGPFTLDVAIEPDVTAAAPAARSP